MSRLFTPTTDKVTLALGSLGFAPPVTIVALVKKAADGTLRAAFHAGTDASTARWGLAVNASNQVQLRISGNLLFSTTVTLTVADGWALIVGSKATGTVAGRLHRYRYSDSTVVRANSSSTSGAGTPTTAAYLGGTATAGAEPWSGHIAAVAVYNKVLTDAEVDGLVNSFQAWLALSPVAAWRLDQAAVTTAINDQVGTANQTARSGTTVAAANEPASWTYDAVARTASITATGGGVLVPSRTSARSRAVTGVGGGVLVTARSSQRSGSATLTGGGVVVTSRSSARSRTMAGTGGGVFTRAVVAGRASSSSATGGGVLTVLASASKQRSVTDTGGGVASITEASVHTSTVLSSGGGVTTPSRTTERLSSPAGTGGGVFAVTSAASRAVATQATGSGALIVTQTSSRSTQVTDTGGGRAFISYAVATGDHRSSSVSASGGGIISFSALGAHTGVAIATGAGAASARGVAGHVANITASASGIVSLSLFSSRQGSVTATGGGVLAVSDLQVFVQVPGFTATITPRPSFSGTTHDPEQGSVITQRPGATAEVTERD